MANIMTFNQIKNLGVHKATQQRNELLKVYKAYSKIAPHHNKPVACKFRYIDFLSMYPKYWRSTVSMHVIAPTGPNYLIFYKNRLIDLAEVFNNQIFPIITYYPRLKTIKFHTNYLSSGVNIQSTKSAVLGFLNMFPLTADITELSGFNKFGLPTEYMNQKEAQSTIIDNPRINFEIPVLHILKLGRLWDYLWFNKNLYKYQKKMALKLILRAIGSKYVPVQDFTTIKSVHTKGYKDIDSYISQNGQNIINATDPNHFQKDTKLIPFINKAVRNAR